MPAAIWNNGSRLEREKKDPNQIKPTQREKQIKTSTRGNSIIVDEKYFHRKLS
jgi:hypothetical protein